MYMKAQTRKTASTLREESASYAVNPEPAMVRTQLYLTKSEHCFVQAEASRLGKPMAAVIRDWIDEKIGQPEDPWTKSSLLDPPAATFKAPEDLAINHDHYLYGGPKKYAKVKGKWVLQPPLDE
jgi:hypothetical protein